MKVLRRRRGLTQEQLARMIFVSRSSLGPMEINKRVPGPVVVQLLSKVFGVSSEFLLTGKKSPYDEYVERLYAMDWKIDVSKLSREHQVLVLKFFDGVADREGKIVHEPYTIRTRKCKNGDDF